MKISLNTTLKIGVSALALALSSVPVSAQNVLSRAQVVGGTDACPAIFVSFNTPLTFAGSALTDGGRGLRIRLNREENSAGARASDPIETYPNLRLDNLGQVGITLNSSGADPVLIMRFDQAIMAGVDVVQAGDSSVVITGIAADGAACGAEAPAQDPLLDAESDAVTAPSIVDMADPAQAEIEAIYAEARAAITAQDYRRALQLLTKLTQMPPHTRSADSQELLGVVRERNSQFAHAQAEYEAYLEAYPDSPGASRVRQRLAALRTALSRAPELRDAGPGFSGPTDGPVRVSGGRRTPPSGAGVEDEIKTFTAIVSSYYYLNQGSTQLTDFNTNRTSSDSTVFNNSIVTSVDMSDTVKTDDFTLNWRVTGDYELDMADSTQNSLRLSKAYGEFNFNNTGLAVTLGRQTRYDGGILGRFDGGLLALSLTDRLTIKATAGLPVNSSSDGLFASDRLIMGASIDMTDLQPGLDVAAYFAQQNFGNYTDRQAVGVEVQFQNEMVSAFAQVDYDIYLNALNIARFSGTKTFDDLSSLTVSADYLRSPILTLSNATVNQPVASDTLGELLGAAGYTLDQVKQLAIDRSAPTAVLAFAYSLPVNEQWMASINASTALNAATPASGGVASTAATVENYFTTQLVGNSVFSERDVVSVSARYADNATSQSVLLDGYRRFQVSDSIRLKTRVKIGHKSVFSLGVPAAGSSEWYAIPSVNMTYRTSDMLDFEVEVGGRYSTTAAPGTTTNTNDLFMFAGFSKQF